MYKNYFYINRAVLEQREKVIGATIYEIYSQEKDTLYFNISSPEFPDRHLVISINQNEPYILLKDHHKAKKNTVDFFEADLPQSIKDFQMSDADRIFRIVCHSAAVYSTIRGTLSNVMFINNKGTTEFFEKVKKIDKEEFSEELLLQNYTAKFNLPDFGQTEADNLDELKKSLPYLTKDILKELKARNGTEIFELRKNILLQILKEIYTENINVFYSPEMGRFVFMPETFKSLTPEDEVYNYPDYQSALIKLISLKYRYEKIYSLKKDIGKYLERELSGLSSKLNNLKSRVNEGPKDKLYRLYADLLISNLYQLKKGMKEIVLTDYNTGQPVKIKLNEKLSPQQNVDYFYDKARGEKINFEKSASLFRGTQERYNKLLRMKNKYEETKDEKVLQMIKEELGIKEKKKVMENIDERIKFRHFIVDGKYHVYVGRDSQSNDLLSVKFAKQNDYWFHARGLPGSHVVLRVDNPKEGIPKSILKNAASIAAYYSKAKTAGTAPVVCTFAKYVNKRKGMEPGKVSVQREDVLLVKPGIPPNTVQVDE